MFRALAWHKISISPFRFLLLIRKFNPPHTSHNKKENWVFFSDRKHDNLSDFYHCNLWLWQLHLYCYCWKSLESLMLQCDEETKTFFTLLFYQNFVSLLYFKSGKLNYFSFFFIFDMLKTWTDPNEALIWTEDVWSFSEKFLFVFSIFENSWNMRRSSPSIWW